MTREQVLAILKKKKPILQECYGIERVGIFGSIARNESIDTSDVDVVVEMAPDISRMVHVKEFLEEAFQTPVDLVRYRERMNTFLKKRIDKEAVYV